MSHSMYITIKLALYNTIQFACSNRFWNRTEQIEPVLTGSVLVQFSSGKKKLCKFGSRFSKNGERTGPN